MSMIRQNVGSYARSRVMEGRLNGWDVANLWESFCLVWWPLMDDSGLEEPDCSNVKRQKGDFDFEWWVLPWWGDRGPAWCPLRVLFVLWWGPCHAHWQLALCLSVFVPDFKFLLVIVFPGPAGWQVCMKWMNYRQVRQNSAHLCTHMILFAVFTCPGGNFCCYPRAGRGLCSPEVVQVIRAEQDS